MSDSKIYFSQRNWNACLVLGPLKQQVYVNLKEKGPCMGCPWLFVHTRSMCVFVCVWLTVSVILFMSEGILRDALMVPLWTVMGVDNKVILTGTFGAGEPSWWLTVTWDAKSRHLQTNSTVESNDLNLIHHLYNSVLCTLPSLRMVGPIYKTSTCPWWWGRMVPRWLWCPSPPCPLGHFLTGQSINILKTHACGGIGT